MKANFTSCSKNSQAVLKESKRKRKPMRAWYQPYEEKLQKLNLICKLLLQSHPRFLNLQIKRRNRFLLMKKMKIDYSQFNLNENKIKVYFQSTFLKKNQKFKFCNNNFEKKIKWSLDWRKKMKRNQRLLKSSTFKLTSKRKSNDLKLKKIKNWSNKNFNLVNENTSEKLIT